MGAQALHRTKSQGSKVAMAKGAHCLTVASLQSAGSTAAKIRSRMSGLRRLPSGIPSFLCSAHLALIKFETYTLSALTVRW